MEKIICKILILIMVLGVLPQGNYANAKTKNDKQQNKDYIIQCKDSDSFKELDSKIDIALGSEAMENNNIHVVNMSKEEANELKKDGNIVEMDSLVTGSAKNQKKKNFITLTKKELEWNIRSLGDDTLKRTTLESEGIKIAILDSGIDYSESINVVERKNFMDDDVTPLCEDNTGHGTAIAGIIASDGSGNTINGINPNVEIYSARILDCNNQAPISRVVDAIYWAIDCDVNIINLSFGTNKYSEILHNAIKKATEEGILIFAASGNQGKIDGVSNVEYPAAFDEVAAVGATNAEGNISDMTSRGEELDIVAPGENVRSIGWLGLGVVCSGTSMSVPHAVGAASILWQKDRNKPADFIKGLLEASAKKVDDGEEEYSFIDLDYANEIYDDYYSNYRIDNDIEKLNKQYDNKDDVEDYSDVTGSWSKSNHAKTVDYAYEKAGGLTASDVQVVKLGVRAPDIYYNDASYGTTTSDDLRMFHARHSYNYVKVYEDIMNMALKCKTDGIGVAQKIPYPDGYAGDYNECVTARNYLRKSNISVILEEQGNLDYSKKGAALILMGFAMHVVGDTYAHKSWELYDGRWVSHGAYPVGNMNANANDKFGKKKDDGTYNRADDIDCCPERFTCAKKACYNILACWNGSCPPSFADYITSKHGNIFRLECLYTRSQNCQNGIDFNYYSSTIRNLSYAD